MRAALVYAVLAAVALAIAVLPGAKPLSGAAAGRAQDVAEAGIAVYAALRAVNAAISLVQQAEIGASIGVSGTVRPLGWLDPVDDTVERAAAVVFWIVLAAGVAVVAMDPLSAIGWGLLAVLCAARGAARLVGARRGGPTHAGAVRARGERGLGTLGAGLVRLPLVLWLGLALGERLTAATYDEAFAVLSEAEAQAEPVIRPYGTPPPVQDDDGWLDWARSSWESTREAARAFASTTQLYYEEATDLFRALMTILGVFLFRLVVLPAALLWVFLLVLRRAL